MEDQQISLLGYLAILKKRYRSILFITCFFFVMGLVKVSLAPRIYQAESVIMAVGGSHGSDGGLGQLLAMSFGGGASSASGGGGAKQLELFLRSRTLAERVVRRMRQESARPEQSDATVANEAYGLLRSTKVSLATSQAEVINFVVDGKDPELVTKINKTYLSELQVYMNDNLFTEAKRQRTYVEQQLIARRKEFLELCRELSDFYKQNRVSAVTALVDVDVSADLTPQAGDLNDVNKTEQITDVPQQVYLEYLGQRKLQLLDLIGLLMRQYETTKMDEAREDVSFQILDSAFVPDAPYKPQVEKILFSALVAGILAAIFYAFFAEYVAKLKGSSWE